MSASPLAAAAPLMGACVLGLALGLLVAKPAAAGRARRAEKLRAEERAGRVRAERALALAAPHKQQDKLPGARRSDSNLLTLRPLGVLRSVFDTRNGCPRQPLLAPSARARLTLAPHVPAACLEGLEEYSHCWVLYAFNHNTDGARGARTAQRNPAGMTPKAKVGVPRLNGALKGALATRTPHRPCAIGLSVGTIVAVGAGAGGGGKRGWVDIGGLDCVDGTVVLDIKPYVPFADSVDGAHAPRWVDRALPGEEVGVAWAEGAREEVSAAWAEDTRGSQRLLADAGCLVALAEEVLARDIRSAHRKRVDGALGAARAVRHSLALDGVLLEYELRGDEGVRVLGGRAR